MKIKGRETRTIWLAADGSGDIEIIDQTVLPHAVEIVRLRTLDEAAHAIRAMLVRGAPLIGATAAHGLCLALRDDASDANLKQASTTLLATRPTAVNLAWALDEMNRVLAPLRPEHRLEAARKRAVEICDEDVETCRRIGEHGLTLIRDAQARRGGGQVNVLTHCNAGWLATVDWGTAIELGQQGVAHTIIADNVGGHLLQHDLVDLVIVGTDRTTRTGDVANKIGTYLKALAAADNGVPFHVALPGSTVDWTLRDGVKEIPIEQRDATEVTRMTGRTASGEMATVDIAAPGSPAANYAFDVTPARLVTGLITERGVCAASEAGLLSLFPEHQLSQ